MLKVYIGRSILWVKGIDESTGDLTEDFNKVYKQIEIDPWIKAKVQEIDKVELTDKYTFMDKDGKEKSIVHISDTAKLCICLYAFPQRLFYLEFSEHNLANLTAIFTVPRGHLSADFLGESFDYREERDETPIYDKYYEIPALVWGISEYQIHRCETVRELFLFIDWYYRRLDRYRNFGTNHFLKEHAIKRLKKPKGFEYMTITEFINLNCRCLGRSFIKYCVTAAFAFDKEQELAYYQQGNDRRRIIRDKEEFIAVSRYSLKKRYIKEVTRKQRAALGFGKGNAALFPTQEDVVEKLSELHWLPRLRSAKLGLIGAYAAGKQNKSSVIEVVYWPQEEGFPLIEWEFGRKSLLIMELEKTFHKEVIIHDYREITQELRKLHRPFRGLRFQRRDLTEQERQEEIKKRERIIKAVENDALWVELSKELPAQGPIDWKKYEGLHYVKEKNGCDIYTCVVRVMVDLKKNHGIDEFDTIAVISDTMPYLFEETVTFGLSETSQKRIKGRVIKAVKARVTVLCQKEIQNTLDRAGTRDKETLKKDLSVVKALAFDLNRLRKLVGEMYETDFEFMLWVADVDELDTDTIIALALELDKMELTETDTYKVIGIRLSEEAGRKGSTIEIECGGKAYRETNEETGRDELTRDYASIDEIVSYNNETGIITFKATTYTGEEEVGQANVNEILENYNNRYHTAICKCIEKVEILPNVITHLHSLEQEEEN